MLKQRLTRAEGQLKMHEERVMTYESALEQARTQTRNLERTIQQLNEQVPAITCRNCVNYLEYLIGTCK